MGEYEDRYPDAYGRNEAEGQPTPREELLHPAGPRQVRDPVAAVPPGAENAPGWQHAPSAAHAAAAPAPSRSLGSFRGIGPRGYRRSPERIYEDICDRLADNPFIDASDIEVRVDGPEVTLSGSVDNAVAFGQAQEIAAEVAGVRHVHNRLTVRADIRDREVTPGDQVNRALGTTAR